MSTVQVKLAGVDRTSQVVFSSAYFMSAVNGIGGEAKVRFRDPDRTLAVTPGDVLELIIDGDPVWYGFSLRPKRVYVFAALNIVDFGLDRFVDVEAVDLNVLFERRIVFDQATPENVLSPLYPVNTPDTDAITDLLADWLDLSGDGLDTSSGVIGVGNINVNQKARPWSGADTWGQAMQSIASLPAAIYYLRPNKELAYVDTDTPDAPFGLSDVPNHTTMRGYREMEILLDGGNLANDVMTWGIGYGSSVPVFKRAIDAASVTEHGLWQLGQVTYGVYKQATIDRIADSILNGSPEHHRGSKDDRTAVILTTYEPGLLPAQKVPFESQVFGFSDVFPIRKMEVTFEAPDKPKYGLTLSHEIDTPFGFFDPFLFNWRFPKFIFPPFGFPLPGPVTCSPSVCGITDDFRRTVADGLGTSTAGIDWPYVAGESVDGTQAIIGGSTAQLTTGPCAEASVTLTRLIGSGGGVYFGLDTSGPAFVEADFYDDGTIEFYDVTTDLTASLAWSPATETRFHIVTTATEAHLYIWKTSDPPSLVPVLSLTGVYGSFNAVYVGGFSGTTSMSVKMLDVVGVNRCITAQIDDFQRSESGVWGDASSGPTWDLSQSISFPYVWDVTNGAGQVNISDSHGGDPIAILAVSPTPTFTVGPVDVYTDLWVDTVVNTGAGGATGQATVSFFLSTIADIQTNINVNMTCQDTGSALLNVTYQDANGDGGGSDQIDAGNLQGEWMRIHMQLTDSGLRAVAWPRGTNEPNFQVVSDNDFTAQMVQDIGNGAPLQIGYSILGGVHRPVTDPPQDFFIRVDNINLAYSGSPCYPGGPPPTQSPSINAWVCEQFDVVTTTLTLVHPYLALSPQVWLNGLLQLQSTYTMDPLAGTITFGSTPGPTANARVCYWSL